MSDEVQQDISDFRGGFRLATFWSDLFLSLECAIMLVSLVINICLVRAVAFNKHKVSYFLHMKCQNEVDFSFTKDQDRFV